MYSYQWIKLWIETIDDPKTARLSDNLWRRFFECCMLAAELNQKGRLPSIADIAWRLRIEEESLKAEFDSLARASFLDHIATDPLDHHWTVTNFEKRQAKMGSKERMKRKRERDRLRSGYETGYGVVTSRNIEEKENRRREEIEEDNTIVVDRPNIFQLFENNIGSITPIMRDKLLIAEESYCDQWIERAFEIAVESNVRKWNYVEAILKNWDIEGFGNNGKNKKGQKNGTTQESTKEPTYTPEQHAAAEKIARRNVERLRANR